jgi:hypothetical protein
MTLLNGLFPRGIRLPLLGSLLLALLALESASAQNPVTPGEMTIHPPTLICLGFYWEIEGDNERDATVEVRYRKVGTRDWQVSLPLYRISDTAFCGSVLDLESGTEYEVAFKIDDPDGVTGEPVKMLTTSTRAVPQSSNTGMTRHVYPPDYKGPKEEPHYKNIMAAVNGKGTSADDETWTDEHAQPGDTILLHAGTYQGDWKNYRDPQGLWHYGTHNIVWDGEPDNPITVKAAGDGEVIIDGANRDGELAHILFDVEAADYWIFEGLTLRNAKIAFLAGKRGVAGCKGLVVRNCRLENVGNGVLGLDGRCEGFVITDNVFLGLNDPDNFHKEAGSASGRSQAGYAVNLIGAGHSVGFNRVERFWDGINVSTNAMADPKYGQQAYAIDFYNNDLYNICDNFIESDGGMWNIRILRNRGFNSLAAPLSIQPVYEGPVYWIRNVTYNSGNSPAFKLLGASAMVAYHNTTFSYFLMDRSHFLDMRNNVFRGTPVEDSRPTRKRVALKLNSDHRGDIINHNAYGLGLPGDIFIFQDQGFARLAEFAQATGFETDGVELEGLDAFVNAGDPFRIGGREDRRLVSPDDVNLSPAPGSPLIDAGTVIPGLGSLQEFTGNAPDIGAYEAGLAPPHYGPRE